MTKRIQYGELENGMLVWLEGVLFKATDVRKTPTVPMMHETLKPENHTTVRFTGVVVNDESLKNTAYNGGVYGGYSWVLVTIEDQPAPDSKTSALTAEQLEAIQQFAKQHGRNWKSALREAWMTGDYGTFEASNLLQQIRNTFGPSWLVSFRLPVKTLDKPVSAVKGAHYDYVNQAWTRDGKYTACRHPESLHCECYGKEHAGEVAPIENLPTAAGVDHV